MSIFPFNGLRKESFGLVFLTCYAALGVSITSTIVYIALDCKYSHIYIVKILNNTQENLSKEKDQGKWQTIKQDIKKVEPTFWCLFFAQNFTANTFWQFMAFITSYSINRFHMDYQTASNLTTLIYFG